MSGALTGNSIGTRTQRRGSRRRTVATSVVLMLVAGLLGQIAATESSAQAGTFDVTLRVGNYLPAEPYFIPDQVPKEIHTVRYLVSVDNSGVPNDPDPALHPGVKPMASNSPIERQGLADEAVCDADADPFVCEFTINDLPDGRYLITIQANPGTTPDTIAASTTHKMWGIHVSTADAGTTKHVDLIPQPLPLGKLVVFAFADNAPVNGAPDILAEAGGLEGFNVVLEDITAGIVTQNFLGDPICAEYDGSGNYIDGTGGECLTGPDGVATIDNLGPGKYEIHVIPPNQSYIQTTTFEGGFAIDFSVVTEGDDGLGAIREGLLAQLTQPTSYWFGFVQEKDFPTPGTGSITGCAATWSAFPPFDTPVINKNEPIQSGFVALTDVGNDQQVYTAPLGNSANCPGGVIDIQNVPEGNYTMFLWDEQLNLIFREINVAVSSADPNVDVGDVGIFRWFGWLSGHIYTDNGIAKNGTPIPGDTARNGVRDCLPGPVTPQTCEAGIPHSDLDIRARDGETLNTSFTDANGYYEYPTEISKMFKFRIGEVGFGRYGTSGPSVCNEILSSTDPGWENSQYNPDGQCVKLPTPNELGGGLLTNQVTIEGHRSTVNWGKYPYAPDEPGQITGIITYGTTRNEIDARFAGAEPYEPGIANVPVNLWTLGPNGVWDQGTGDDVLVSRYADAAGSDAWSHPTDAADSQGAGNGCDVLNSDGTPTNPQPVTHFGMLVAPNCLEFGSTNNETKDGAFDGGYAFAEYCPAGWDDNVAGGCASPEPLVAGKYVIQVEVDSGLDPAPAVDPAPYEIVKEEDVNVTQGEEFVPQPALAPAECVGEMHTVPPGAITPAGTPSPFIGQDMPLCDERLVDLKLGENPPSTDFFLFTETPIPARVFGLVTDDIRVDTDPTSPWYGEPRAIPDIPIGIRDYSYRLITTLNTDEYGFYESILPSTDTSYCPTPAGTCPGTYVFVINDPEGEKQLTGNVATTAGGSTVTGTGTNFAGPDAEIKVGDRIRIGNEVKFVTAISSETSLTIDTTWDNSNSGAAAYRVFMNPNFDPNYLTEPLSFSFMPGTMTPLDTPLDPISGVACSDYAGPEFFAVGTTNGSGTPADPDSGLVIAQSEAANSELRTVTIHGLGFGASRVNPTFPSEPGNVTLIHPDGTRYVVPNFRYISWSDEEIKFRFPKADPNDTTPPIAQLRAAPYQVLVTTPRPDPQPSVAEQIRDPLKSLTAPTGITLHYVGSAYNPPRKYVDGLNGSDSNSGTLAAPYRTIQHAIDQAAAGALIIVAPATYPENVILYKRQKLQGFGPGGINGTRELPDPPEDEVRRQVPGTVINASFFNSNSDLHNDWQAKMNSFSNAWFPGGPLPAPSLVKAPAAAGITVVGGSTTFGGGSLTRATIDGFGIHSARTDAVFNSGGGGGIFVNGYGRLLKIGNNFIEANHGFTGGGIVLGQPYRGTIGNLSNQNTDVEIAYNRILGNGGTKWAGGIGIYNGADRYLVRNNDICANFSAEYGGGLSQYGRSINGAIRANKFYFNDAFDEGGGVMISGQLPGTGVRPNGTGGVTVERNVFSSNQSGDDGGAIKVSDAVREVDQPGPIDSASPDRINILNNQITNNNAADLGAVAIDDSPNVYLVNNTIAKNTTTASCEGCIGGGPHSAGLASEPNADWLQPTLPAGSPEFSNPVLLNNLFWGNEAFTFDPTVASDAPDNPDGTPAPLLTQGFIDLEVYGRPDLQFRPKYSALSTPYAGADSTNVVFADPEPGPTGELVSPEDPFVRHYNSVFELGFNAATGEVWIGILAQFGTEPTPPGHNNVPGDYHLCDPRQPSPSVPDFAGTNQCSPKAIDKGGDNLSPSTFAGTVVPAPTTNIQASDIDIDNDPRPLDIAFFANAAGQIGFDIGSDEMKNPGPAWIGNFA